MRLKTQHPFKEFTAYLVYHGVMHRKMVCLVSKKGEQRTTMSLARYLYCLFRKEIIDNKYQVHHINKKKREDRIKNLCLVEESEHHQLHVYGELHVELICPQCGVIFNKPKRNTHYITPDKPATACSRKCGGKLSWLSPQDRLKLKQEQKILREFYK